jgi:hypothetical protein
VVNRKLAKDSKYDLELALPPLSPENKVKMEQKKRVAREKNREKAKTVANKADSGGTRRSGGKGCQVMYYGV